MQGHSDSSASPPPPPSYLLCGRTRWCVQLQRAPRDGLSRSGTLVVSIAYLTSCPGMVSDAQERAGVAVGDAHLPGDGRHGLVRQIFQDRAAPCDDALQHAAVPGQQQRRPTVQALLDVAQPLFQIRFQNGNMFSIGLTLAGRGGECPPPETVFSRLFRRRWR